MAQVLYHNVSVHEFVCEGLPSWGLGMGVAMGIAGSIGINIGQNVQAMGIKSLGPTEYTSPWRSRQWRIGLFIFIAFALINFGALAFAPASILVPIESLQFVTNVAWNSVVNKIRVGLRMQLGVLLALVGTSLSVVFGAPSICHSPAQMKEYWASTAWWLFLAITLSCATCCFMMHRFSRRRWKQTGELPPHPALLPVCYSLYCSLIGGGPLR
jgi:drug/metabolite transporter (DMT)-like permease